jgi:regulator of replication initiation timing
MAKSAAAAQVVDLAPIDRLENKIRALVATLDRMRAEQARLAEDNQRLIREIEALRARLSDADSAGAELTALREERDLVRARVSEMLQQLDGLNL